EQTPSISIDKQNGGVLDLDANGQDAGDQIVYDYTVSNTGNVTLFNVTAADDQLGPITLTGLTDEDSDGFADDLAVGGSASGSASATLTQAQVDSRSVTNTSTASGTPPAEGAPSTPFPYTTLFRSEQTPSISIDKQNGGVLDLDANGQ